MTKLDLGPKEREKNVPTKNQNWHHAVEPVAVLL
jgi:hypothetical protein